MLVTGFVIDTVNIFLSSNNLGFRVEKVESLEMLLTFGYNSSDLTERMCLYLKCN